MSRGRLLVAIVVAVVVVMAVAGGAAYLVLGRGGGSPSATPTAVPTTLPTEVTTGATDKDYYDLAATASDVTLASFTPPPKSTKVDGSPVGWVAGASMPQSDPTLTREAWWSTPLSMKQVASYLDAGTPSSVTTRQTVSGSGSNKGIRFQSREYGVSGNPVYMAYSAPVLTVAYQRIGDLTYLEAISYETPRYAVPDQYRINEPISSVQIDQTTTVVTNGQSTGTKRAPTVTYSAPADAATIAGLVKAYNAMPAGFTIPIVTSCPMAPSTSTSTTVTFTSEAGHTWTAVSAGFFCGLGGFTVSYDGQVFDQTLDGSAMNTALP